MTICPERDCPYFGQEVTSGCGCVLDEKRTAAATLTAAGGKDLSLLERAANTIDALTNIAGHSLARHQITSAREIAAALRETGKPAAPATDRFAIPEFLRKHP